MKITKNRTIRKTRQIRKTQKQKYQESVDTVQKHNGKTEKHNNLKITQINTSMKKQVQPEQSERQINIQQQTSVTQNKNIKSTIRNK